MQYIFSTEAPQTRIWGRLEVEENKQAHIRLGPLFLWVQHFLHEWRVIYTMRPLDEVSAHATIEDTISNFLADADTSLRITRTCLSKHTNTVYLRPMLADRPVVTKPEKPLYVAAGQATTLYVSFPVWLRIEVGDPPLLLQELPSMLLSDTWSGESTREGEICYASRTLGRLTLGEFQLEPYRVMTVLTIFNRTDDNLLIDAVKIAMPSLSLYQDADGMLWTDALEMEHVAGVSASYVQEIKRHIPRQAKQPHLLTGPRVANTRTMFTKALDSLRLYSGMV